MTKGPYYIRDSASTKCVSSGIDSLDTILAGSHTRMFTHLDSLAFFGRAAIPVRVYCASAFAVLETEGGAAGAGWPRRRRACLAARPRLCGNARQLPGVNARAWRRAA